MSANKRFELRGARILLTGASRGIGPYIARALAAEGAHLALVARTSEPLEVLARQLRSTGINAVPVTADLARKDERNRLVRRVDTDLGPVDVLVNNAGLEQVGRFAEEPEDRIAEIVEVNVVAPMHLTRLLLPGMLERRRGRVVNIASAAGKKAVPYSSIYGGTKAALVEWTSALRIELAGSGVSASAVCPGFVRGEGMFARDGVAPPRSMGSVTPAQVAVAVVRVLRTDEPEIIVNARPIRPLLAVYQLSPGLATRVLGWFGVTQMQRKRAALGGSHIARGG